MVGRLLGMRLDDAELAKLDQLKLRLQCKSPQEVLRQLLRDAPLNGDRPRELEMPQDTRSRRLYQALLDDGRQVFTRPQLVKLKYRAAIRTDKSLENNLKVLEGLWFVVPGRDEQQRPIWRVRKIVKERE